MEKVGVFVVSYGARAVAMVEAFAKSTDYDARIYVADKQRNPYNMKKSVKHVVIPDLDVGEICQFAEANRDEIDFGIVGPEKPVINGIRDIVEENTNIPMICPTKEYAIESSKVSQRRLFQKIVPEVNPRFKIFTPHDYENQKKAREDVYSWLDELENQAVVKPDRPAAGKGVGVWGDHFSTREELFEHFLTNLRYGPVIIEEKIEGEESSFQAFCDGRHLVPLPETRDYKRAFNGDRGPNTGGMGSYKNIGDTLPFMTRADREKEIEIITKIFERWKTIECNALRGMPFYVAFMHTKDGLKILENNSRPGDPEIINILPLLKQDFIDICFKMLEGNLTHVELEKAATVVTYKVPPNYSQYMNVFPELVQENEIGNPIDLAKAYRLSRKSNGNILIYPASMELRNNETYALKSRTVASVGIGATVQEAREMSTKGLKAIQGGSLWYRTDIASKQHIGRSVKHMEELRRHKY